MNAQGNTLQIAEIPYDSGAIRFRYSRYMSDDGMRWIRHGPFVHYMEDGTKASEVEYAHGVEEGPCREFHENGSLAAEGAYRAGKEHGTWHFWAADGTPEKSMAYVDGREVDA